MGVKDLVDIYESSAANAPSSRSSGSTGTISRRSQRGGNDALSMDVPLTSGSSGNPSPRRHTNKESPNRPARFLPHPLLSARHPDASARDIPLRPVQHPTTLKVPSTLHKGLEKRSTMLAETDGSDHTETGSVHDYNQESHSNRSSSVQTKIRSTGSSKLSSTRFAGSFTVVSKPDDDTATVVSTSTVVQPLAASRSYKPVPAIDLFDRYAAPLFLPKLDEYLASIRVPEFAKWKGKENETNVYMFPPMDRLAAEKKSLDDLEHNSLPTPGWRNRNTWFGMIFNFLLGVAGSSAVAPFYSVQGLLDTIQIFALILNTMFPNSGSTISDKWKKLFLGTIPNVLALNFISTATQTLIYLFVLMCITLGLLYYMFRVTNECRQLHSIEGLQSGRVGSRWTTLIVTFILTTIYLPLSTLAVHVIVWTDDLWVVPNPYLNATTSPPSLPPLGPPDQYRDPLDFCWTTTMKRNEVNFAPILMICALILLASLTIWFPIRLYHAIEYAVPTVDKYTELGRPRSHSEKNREYQRLLARDKNPLNFLYSGYRRGWGSYQSIYLLIKLSSLLITALIDPNTCVLRSLDRSKIAFARQIVLLVVMFAFFVLQCFFAPFQDPVSNASEWTSRLNYVLISAVALAVAVNGSINDILDGVVLYIIYISTYSLVIYFTIIDIYLVHRWLKTWTGRVDFSIDIFSPRLNVSSSSPHTKRRIWQEAITTLFLTTSSCRIPPEQLMEYAEGVNSDYAPYLLNFAGFPGERHVENLKILREVGSLTYTKGVSLIYGPDYALFRHLEETIQNHFVGPDCFWKSPSNSAIECGRFFGNAWWIPFPPSLVIRFDDGSSVILKEVAELEEYVNQNTSEVTRRRREIRMALRALSGKIVFWPYEHIVTSGSQFRLCCQRRGYKATTTINFESCVFQIQPRGQLVWQGLQIGSGFDVQLIYSKNVKVDGDIIGLNDDLELTSTLARFLVVNERLIPQRLEHIQIILDNYRKHYIDECREKATTLSYRFLTNVYDRPRDPTCITESTIEHERDPRVRKLMLDCEDALKTTYERLSVVSESEVATWWYIFWDDVWRQNYDTISALKKHAEDFNPHFPSSIAYRPLSRPILEQFLTQRGLFKSRPKGRTVFHPGFLNMIYIRLNDIVFHSTSEAIAVHLGDGKANWDMNDIDLQTQGHPSTLGTGGGTDHDDDAIRPRPSYKWEMLMSSPVKECIRGAQWFAAKVAAWFGLTPLWRPSFTVTGFSLDLRLDEEGRYVPFEENDRDGRSLDESK